MSTHTQWTPPIDFSSPSLAEPSWTTPEMHLLQRLSRQRAQEVGRQTWRPISDASAQALAYLMMPRDG